MIINPSLHTLESLTGVIAIDVETTGLSSWSDTIHSIAIADRNEMYVVDTSFYDKEKLGKSLQYMVDRTKVVMHNAKFDVGFLYGNYGVLAKDVFCTQLASQIIQNGMISVKFNLIATAERYLSVDLMEDNHKKLMRELYMRHKIGDKLSLTMLEYVADDTRHLIPLMEAQQVILKRDNLEKTAQLENLLIPVLAKMETDGCTVDKTGWEEEIVKWEKNEHIFIAELDEIIRELSNTYDVLKQKFYMGERHTMNLTQFGFWNDTPMTVATKKLKYSSQAQVISMLEDMQVDVPLKKIKAKELAAMSDLAKEKIIKVGKDSFKKSLDEISIKEYMNENPKTALKEFYLKLLEFRQNTKLISTYGEMFLDKLDTINNIHTQYTQCRTTTGRLSSLKPNLQNMPKIVRQFFVPSKGNIFVTSDMNSAEVCIAGDYAKEDALLDSVKHGEDLHSKLASKTFSIIFGQDVVVDKSDDELVVGDYKFLKSDLRTAHKTVLFSKFYKAGVTRIYSVLAYHINLFHSGQDRMKVARRISKEFDKTLPKLTAYLSGLIEEANSVGELRGTKLINRRRLFPVESYGEAANFPIQNTNAEAMKIALVNIFEYLEENDFGRLVTTVHDEVVVETKEEYAEEVGTMVAKIMGSSLGMFLEDIEGGASINIGYHWEK